MGIRVHQMMRRSRAVAGGVGLLTLIVVLSGCPNPVTIEEGDQVPEPDPPAEAVTFSPDPGEYDTDTSVELTTATPGATIYYTQDGTEPDAGATEYTGPIDLVGHGTEATITAVAVAEGYEPSEPSAATYTVDYLSGLNYREMTSVPAGDFFQEEPLDADSGGVYIDGFSHTLSGFEIGTYEVTYDLWYTVRVWAEDNGYTFEHLGRQGNNDNRGDGSPPNSNRHEPVTMISWYDAVTWTNAYSEMAGLDPVYYLPNGDPVRSSVSTDPDYADDLDNVEERWNTNDGYRLPSEGEWNYAATYIDENSQTDYYFASGATSSSDDGTDVVAWFGNSADTPGGSQPVGGKQANQLGVHDMSGNVEEWVWDWRASYPNGSRTDYRGPGSGSGRMYRGGSFLDTFRDIWVATRKNGRGPHSIAFTLGLRVARTP